jgi:4-hydroxy-4-methyl-2-oxoglutarate aldolase
VTATSTETTHAVLTHSAATLFEAAAATVRELISSGQADESLRATRFAVDPAIRASWSGARVAGVAFTVQGAGGDNLALHRGIYAAPAGSVLVADVGGAAHGHWGEVLAVAAQVRGIVGLVLDGGVRDHDEQRDLGFPVFSRNDSIVGTRKLFDGEHGTAVTIGGVRVRTGDFVVGDADGVVIIPAWLATEIAERADARVRTELDYLARLRAGASTLDLYHLAGEHDA